MCLMQDRTIYAIPQLTIIGKAGRLRQLKATLSPAWILIAFNPLAILLAAAFTWT